MKVDAKTVLASPSEELLSPTMSLKTERLCLQRANSQDIGSPARCGETRQTNAGSWGARPMSAPEILSR